MAPPNRIAAVVALLDRVAGAFVVGLAATVVLTAPLAVVGAYNATVAALILSAATVVAALRYSPSACAPCGSAVDLLLFCALLLLAVVNAVSAANHLTTERDPGVYNTTALQLVHEGDLRPDVLEGSLSGSNDLIVASTGYAQDAESPAHTVPQFMVGLPIVLSIGAAVFVDAMFWIPAVLTSMALWGLHRLIAPLAGAAASAVVTVALGLSMPFTAAARDALTEPLALLLLVFGASAIAGGEGANRRNLLMGGLVLGAVGVVRLEGPFYLAGPVIFCAFVVGNANPSRRTRLVEYSAFVVPLLVGVAVGQLNGWVSTPGYFGDLMPEVVLSLVALVASVAIGLTSLVVDRPKATTIAHTRRQLVSPSLINLAALAVAFGALAHVWVRPFLEDRRSGGRSSAVVERFQAAEGVPIDGTRTYAELTGRWILWYFGAAAVLLASVGIALLVRECLAGRGRRIGWLLLSILGPGAVAALVRPSIYPDQIWGTRRLLVSALPMVAVGVAIVLGRFERSPRPLARFAMVALASLVVVHPLWTQRDVWRASRTPDLAESIGEICKQIDPGSAVIVLAEFNYHLHLPPAIRTMCEVPVAASKVELGSDRFEELAESALVGGGSLYLIAGTSGVAQIAHPRAVEQLVIEIDDPTRLEVTVESRPDDYSPSASRVILSRLDP